MRLVTQRVGLLVGLLVATLWAPASHANPECKVTVGAPTKDGNVTIRVHDTNSNGNMFLATAAILGTDTQEQKAQKISQALITAKLTATPPLDGTFITRIGNEITIEKPYYWGSGSGGWKVSIVSDGTGEGDDLSVETGLSSSNNWVWRTARELTNFSTQIVPNGKSFTMSFTTGPSATVSGDGVKTVGQLTAELSAQLSSQGISFTPVGGELLSNGIPFSVGDPPGGPGFSVTPGYGDYFGGISVEIIEPAAPPSAAVNGLSTLGLVVAVGGLLALGLVRLGAGAHTPRA